MQAHQLKTTLPARRHCSELGAQPPVRLRHARPIAIDAHLIEQAAQSLFEFVFSSCGRVQWATCDDQTKAGFRNEARVVIEAILPRLLR
jgi:hypothetical protein